MRIAHLIWSMGVGGTQTLLTGIANIQVQMGHDVGIFIFDDLVDQSIMDKLDSRIKIFYLKRKRGTKALLPFVKLNWQLWKYHPNIIHSHAGKLSRAIFTRVPMVATVHNMVAAFQNKELHPDNYKKYQRVFAISNAVRDDVIRNGFEHVMVIENGIPCNEIKCKTELKRGDAVHVVQVSRIYLCQKRQDLAVQALFLLKKRLDTEFKSQNTKLKSRRCVMHFVGDGSDMNKLKELVIKLGLEDDVVLEGLKDRQWVFDHLCDYDLFLQPSDSEGFGLTVAEACAAKLPVLVSDIDGPLEVIDGGKLGLVFRHGDAEDLADKLFQFIRDGYDPVIVEDAYKNTLKYYDIAKTTQRYVEEYEKLINNREQ